MVIIFLSRQPMPSLSFGKSTMMLRCQLDGKLNKHYTLHHQYKCKASTSVRSTRHVDRGNGSATRCEGCEGKIKKLDVSISISPCLPKSILQMYCYIKSETVENPFKVSHVSHKLPDYASRERVRAGSLNRSHLIEREIGEKWCPPFKLGLRYSFTRQPRGSRTSAPPHLDPYSAVHSEFRLRHFRYRYLPLSLYLARGSLISGGLERLFPPRGKSKTNSNHSLGPRHMLSLAGG